MPGWTTGDTANHIAYTPGSDALHGSAKKTAWGISFRIHYDPRTDSDGQNPAVFRTDGPAQLLMAGSTSRAAPIRRASRPRAAGQTASAGPGWAGSRADAADYLNA